MSVFELRLSEASKGVLVVDGVDLSKAVRAVTLQAAVGEPTRVWLEFACVRIEAKADEVEVKHVCPWAGTDEVERREEP